MSLRAHIETWPRERLVKELHAQLEDEASRLRHQVFWLEVRDRRLSDDAGTHAAFAQDLVESVMAWWEEHQYDTTGDFNVFDGDPEFVTLARFLVRP